jgi:DNA (cytosine-5)-methyltransferase 1
MLIDAVRWVPQSRPRVFVVAVKKSVNIPASRISSEPNWLHPEAVRKAAVGVKDWIWWDMPEPGKRKHGLADLIEWDIQGPVGAAERHNIRLISPRHAARLDGLADEIRFAAPGYKRTRNGSQVLELRFDDVAGCLRTPSGGSSRQLLVIRENGKLRTRLLTIRETARLMGAPDSYQIPGSYNDGYKAMGDAVAVPVAKWLGSKLLHPLAIASDE